MEFLPTPSHGGRQRQWLLSDRGANFYPRPHMEGDAEIMALFDDAMRISTHALTWRATSLSALALPALAFLPTPSHGGRPKS